MRTIRYLSHSVAWLGIAALTGWTWSTSAVIPGDAAALAGIRVEERAYRTDRDGRATLDVYLPPDPGPEGGAFSRTDEQTAGHGQPPPDPPLVRGGKGTGAPRFFPLDKGGGAASAVDQPGKKTTPSGPDPGGPVERRRRRPAILAIHGGSWSGGSKRLFRADPRNPSLVIRLAQAGFVVVAVDYRLARPASPSWPGVLDDLRQAVRWMRLHAEEFDIDPDRIAALGQSSGAHLAALLGTCPDPADRDGVSSRVQAVIGFYGPSDLARLVSSRRLAQDPVRLLLGDTPDSFPRRADEASPLTYVSHDDPPFLLLHGTDDSWVPPEQSVRLAAKLREEGVKHRFILVAGVRHGFDVRSRDSRDRDKQPDLDEILDFLRTVWNVGSG
jgi:acetyl esterase/lipase